MFEKNKTKKLFKRRFIQVFHFLQVFLFKIFTYCHICVAFSLLKRFQRLKLMMVSFCQSY